VRGVPKVRVPERRSYRLWEEGKAPALVIEVTSATTFEEDAEDKLDLYQRVLKVKEYFLFDPFAENLKPGLIGYRLAGARYASIRPPRRRLPSRVLGLHLENQQGRLRFFNPGSRNYLLTPREELERLRSQQRG
jgi:Uma2 family endonuclease